MLTTQFRRIFVLLLVVGLGTAVFVLTAQATPPRQEDRPSRTNIEDIPHLPLAGTPEAQMAVQAVSVVPASKVAFQSYRSGNWDIFVGNDDGSGQTAVTSHIRADIHPHLNRGSTAVVYASRSDDHDYEIYRVNVDGSNRVALTNNEADDGNPQWSPNGTRIVFESYRDGQAEIYVMNADGSGQTRLTTNGAFDGMPSWSPDGTKIAFSSSRSGAYRIWVMNANGSNPVRLSNQPYSFRPQWSPDGSKIAYDADDNNDTWQELWVMDADGTDPYPRHQDYGSKDVWAGSWSPDGRYIAFTTIHFVYYQGNWYWDYAYLDAITPSGGGNTIRLSQSDVDWYPRWQTSDTQVPTSQIQALSANSPAPIMVRWVGNDTGGSGLRSYDVQVKMGANGTWTDWQIGTTATSGAYNGVGGQTYYFRSRVRDNAFNIEAWPTNADSSTTVESLPPNSSLSPLPPYHRRDQGVPVQWGGSDPGGSGIASYDVQYRIDGGNWVNWQTDTPETISSFWAYEEGNNYEFRVRAIDRAQNEGDWSAPDADSQITFYEWGLAGMAYDNSGAPVSGIGVTTTPGVLGIVADDPDGEYHAYIADASATYTVTWGKNGYDNLPATTFVGKVGEGAAPNGWQDVFLPPANNVVENWGFESGGFDSWQPSGVVTAVVTTNTSHTGQYATRLGPMSLFEPAQGVSNNIVIARNAASVIGSNDAVHLVYFGWVNDSHYEMFYTQRSQSGSWSSPQSLTPNISVDTNTESVQMILGQNGVLHLTWFGNPAGDYSYYKVYYMQRTTSGVWSSPVIISGNMDARYPQIAVDNSGIVHIVWQYANAAAIYYSRRAVNGIWSSPTMLSLIDDYYTDYAHIVAGSDGVVHVVWREFGGQSGEHLYYTRRNTNGIWTTPQILINSSATIAELMLEIDSQQAVHLFWQNGIVPYATLYYSRLQGTVWSSAYPVVQTYFTNADVVVGSDNSLHLVWSDASSSPYNEADIYYKKRGSNGVWSNVQHLSSSLPGSSLVPKIAISSGGALHVVWGNGNCENNYEIYYSQQRANSGWSVPQSITSGIINLVCPTNSEILVDSLGLAHITWDDGTYYPSTGLVYHIKQAVAEETGDAAVSQMITVPMTMTNPALSFLYQLVGAAAQYDTGLFVEVDDGTAVTPLLSTGEEVGDWQHEWVNLAEWSGENITLTFRLHQEEDAPLLYAYLDEVTVGSTYSDVDIDVINDTAILPGEETTLSLIYNNRGGAAARGVTITYTLPAGMTYLSASVPPASTNPFVWHVPDLPAKSDPFEILVTARVNANTPAFTTLTSTAVISTTDPELELLNNQAEGHIYTATFRYLPIIAR